jgi:hypothetical protein
MAAERPAPGVAVVPGQIFTPYLTDPAAPGIGRKLWRLGRIFSGRSFFWRASGRRLVICCSISLAIASL